MKAEANEMRSTVTHFVVKRLREADTTDAHELMALAKLLKATKRLELDFGSEDEIEKEKTDLVNRYIKEYKDKTKQESPAHLEVLAELINTF